MIKNFAEIEGMAREVGPKRISVLRAQDREFLLALKEAHRRGYGEPVLIGNESEIRTIADEIAFDISNFQVIDEKDPLEIARKGVELVSAGETHFILRGHIEGAPLYKALIKAAYLSGVKRQICVVAMMQFPKIPKLVALTDTGITIAPDFRAKIEIIRSAVDLFFRLGYKNPTVGILTAQRGLNDELDSVSDAVKIRGAVARGELTGCKIEEGLCLSDFFLGRDGFLESHGEIDFSRIPDILLVHNLEFGNIFVKLDSLSPKDHFPGFRRHGIIMGAGVPTAIPSRADMHDTIITDIALGVLLSS